MKSLNKSQLKERSDHANKIRAAFADLESAVQEANKMVNAHNGVIAASLDDVNAAIANAIAWKEGIAQEMEDYADERSDKWREGDNGQSYQGWIDDWSQDLEVIDFQALESLDLPGLSAADDLENLAESPN